MLEVKRSLICFSLCETWKWQWSTKTGTTCMTLYCVALHYCGLSSCTSSEVNPLHSTTPCTSQSLQASHLTSRLTQVPRLGLLWTVSEREMSGESQLSCAELPPGTEYKWGLGAVDAYVRELSPVRQDEPGTKGLISACIWRQKVAATPAGFF